MMKSVLRIIPICIFGGCNQGAITDMNAVMQFISFSKSSQNCNGVGDSWLLNDDGLETTSEGSVFFHGLEMLWRNLECTFRYSSRVVAPMQEISPRAR